MHFKTRLRNGGNFVSVSMCQSFRTCYNSAWRRIPTACGQQVIHVWHRSPSYPKQKLLVIEDYPQWRHNGCNGVSNHQPHDCLLKRFFGRRSKKTSTFRVTGLCAGNSPVTGEFPEQRARNAENVSIWWRHHAVVTWVGGYRTFKSLRRANHHD